MMTPKASYLEHAAVTVADIEWSLNFFQTVLGMTETRRKEKDGVLQQVWLKGGLQLVAAPEDPAAGRGHHLGIVVQDFKAALQEMLAYEGVRSLEGKPEKWVKLPDGLVLELFQEKPGAIEKVLDIEVK
ncbi:Glyoxalase-like domain-containing protein [Selenomonas ruminantium]|uniref:Glyoxalase-like domain-containing protein n=1 Tax=Selenomonas ruminantium TaxID=971 RepID=A0A1I3DI55_SELRU|nr:VOC family protein [Selenomonas ruminantium]SFH86323.1 Glyoxalase-like domain-containing protein [Selenomonas ruminantium]